MSMLNGSRGFNFAMPGAQQSMNTANPAAWGGFTPTMNGAPGNPMMQTETPMSMGSGGSGLGGQYPWGNMGSPGNFANDPGFSGMSPSGQPTGPQGSQFGGMPNLGANTGQSASGQFPYGNMGSPGNFANDPGFTGATQSGMPTGPQGPQYGNSTPPPIPGGSSGAVQPPMPTGGGFPAPTGGVQAFAGPATGQIPPSYGGPSGAPQNGGILPNLASNAASNQTAPSSSPIGMNNSVFQAHLQGQQAANRSAQPFSSLGGNSSGALPTRPMSRPGGVQNYLPPMASLEANSQATNATSSPGGTKPPSPSVALMGPNGPAGTGSLGAAGLVSSGNIPGMEQGAPSTKPTPAAQQHPIAGAGMQPGAGFMAQYQPGGSLYGLGAGGPSSSFVNPSTGMPLWKQWGWASPTNMGGPQGNGPGFQPYSGGSPYGNGFQGGPARPAGGGL
ncbi:MAG: hypothetical protein ACYCQK_01400 [Acidiferrobacteraceae bacterium]